MAYKRVDGKKIGWGILGAVALYYLGGLVSGSFDEAGVEPEVGATPDMPPVQGNDFDVPAAPAPQPMPEAPAPQPAPAQAAPATPTPAPAQPTVAPPASSAGLTTPAASGAGMEGSFGKWFHGLSKEAQGIIAGGITGGAGAILQGMSQKNALEDRRETEERLRQDKVRRGQIPDITSSIIAGARR